MAEVNIAAPEFSYAIWTGNRADDMMVRRTSGVGYYAGEAEDAG